MSFPPQVEANPPPPPRARRQPFNSVSTRIIFFVFLSTFLSALVVSWISIHSIHSHLRAEIERRFPAILDDRSQDLEVLADEFRLQIDDLPRNAPIAKALDRPVSGPRLDKIIETRLASMPDFQGLMVLDRGGAPIARVGELDDNIQHAIVLAIAQQSHEPSAPSRVYLDGHGQLCGMMLTPLTVENRHVGWLAGTHDFARFAEVLAPANHEGSARVMLVDAEGQVLARGDLDEGETTTGPVPSRQLERYVDAGVHEYMDWQQTHVLGAGRSLLGGHWLLIVEAPFEVAFAPVLAVVSRIFISDLIIILVFSFLAYKITATIMKPVEALSDGAIRISQGDLLHEIPDSKAQDELGLLIRTFNNMVRQLRHNQVEIEDDQLRLTVQNEELQAANEVLAQLSITDGLTKLHNHRYFQEHLTREIKRVSRTGESLSIILMDLDDFKRLNDRYGHAAGDELLVSIANIMNQSVRETDLLARYGGEEFVILATGTEQDGAVALAEKIRMAVEDSSQIVDDSMRPVKVTISCGIATFDGDRKRFFQAADRALYEAKAEGKNCVITATTLSQDPSA